MLVCSYNSSFKDPVVHRQTVGERKWLIKLYVTDGIVRVNKTIRNKEKVWLRELIEISINELNLLHKDKDLIKPVTEAGFSIYLLR